MQRFDAWATRLRQSVVWNSPLLRRAGPYLLVLCFIQMNLIYLRRG